MTVPIDASPAAQDGAAFGNALRAKTIEDAAAQATMQPWVAMACYQLSRGGQVSQMHTLDLGSQQIVQEHQFAAVQKLGSTPADFCRISYSTPSMAFRFSDHAASCTESIFFMPERTDFDIYVPAGTQTAYIGFSERELLEAARALDPAAWALPSRQVSQLRCAQAGELKAAPDSPEAALQRLMDGNARYVDNAAINTDHSVTRAARAQGQQPFAAIVTCSESRVAPELIFDQGPGDLFVIRVAGNFISEEGLATLEYGVAVLGIKTIVVLGHTACGAVEATIASINDRELPPGQPAQSRQRDPTGRL
ncbi:carbonic anhydrase [Stappia stellulata]|uniref:carbonic anhydrase n=1 Tax=Stappia stellulata TaxID=71235 RepID=UPI00040AE5FB|nr:carbonic anhydrase [Stappia stellulata]